MGPIPHDNGDAHAAAGPAMPTLPTGLVEVPLSVPVDDRGTEVTVLRLRPLRPEDFNRVGLPIVFRADGGYVIEPAIVSALIARAANVAPETIGRLAMHDWWTAVNATIGFLGLSVPTS
jgi:hypothetical protein